MGLFDWSKTKPAAPDEHATLHAAPESQPPAGSVSADLAAAARSNALELSAGRKKRGRPKGAGGESVDDLQAKVDAEIIRQLDAVHDPRAWGALLSSPADVALTITGRDYWKMSDRERDTLGATGSAAARTLMITNPKALAFLMVSAALFAAYMPRLTQELAHQRLKQKDAAAKKAEGGDAAKK